MTDELERIKRLEKALLELVYYELDVGYYVLEGWYTEFMIDTDVTNIIGDLLDEYKPKEQDNPHP